MIQILPANRKKMISYGIGIFYVGIALLDYFYGIFDRSFNWIENDNILDAIDTFMIISLFLMVFLTFFILPTQVVTYDNYNLNIKSLFRNSSFSLQYLISVRYEYLSWMSRLIIVDSNNKKNRIVMFLMPKNELDLLAKMIEESIEPTSQ